MNEIPNFLDAISLFRSNWKAVSFKAVCAYVSEAWNILGANIVLELKESSVFSESPKFPEKTFKVFANSFPIEKLEDLLEGVRIGSIDLNGDRILFKSFDSESILNYQNHFSYYGFVKKMFSDICLRYGDFPRCGLVGSTERISNMTSRMDFVSYSEIEELMLSLDRPYSGLSEFIRSILNIPRFDFGDGSNAPVRVIAPVGVRFSGQTNLENEELKIILDVDPLWNLSDINVNASLSYADKSQEFLSFDIGDFQQSETVVSLRRLSLVRRMPGVWSVGLFLRQHGKFLEEIKREDYSVLDGNPRLAALKYFDFDDIIFGENLGGKKLGGKEKDKTVGPRFESAVAMLLHVCGFNVAHYGQTKGLRDGEIDILAYVPGSNKILAVECTTENIDNKDKLGKLGLRVEKLKDLLPNHNIYPVLATALSREATKNDMKIAAERKIAVLTQEKLQELVQKAHHGESPINIASFILGGPGTQSLQDMIAGGLFGIDE